MKTSYDQLLGRWKEEMDSLLIYVSAILLEDQASLMDIQAGVSSAVLTAFNVESYHLLQPDPSDPTVAMLKQISAQLNGYTFNPPFLNATNTTGPGYLTQTPFQAPASAVWLNSLWFSSLVFSFAAALLALFVKQWIYEAMIGGTTPESARLRQYRFNGLLKWRVGTVVVVLPILLQLASVLFLAGLLVLLWTLHDIVAAITSVLVALVFTFVIGFTLLPVFKSDCSYRSAASFAIYATLRVTRNEVMPVIRAACKVIYRCSMWLDWATMIRYRAQMERLAEFAYQAYDNMPTWRGRDQNEIYLYHGDLNRAIVTTAYSTTADKKFLSSMPVIFSDLPPEQVPQCFQDILDFMEAEWGNWHSSDRLLMEDGNTLPLCATYGIRYMLARSDRGADRWLNDAKIVFRHYFIGNESSEKLAELACKTLCQYAVEDRDYRLAFGRARKTLKWMYDKQGARHTYDTLAHGAYLCNMFAGTTDLYLDHQLKPCTRQSWLRGTRLWGGCRTEIPRRRSPCFCTSFVRRYPANLGSRHRKVMQSLHGVSKSSPAWLNGCVAWSGPGCTRAVSYIVQMLRRSSRSPTLHRTASPS